MTNPAGGEIIATTFRRTQLPNGGFTISRAPLDSGEKVTWFDRFGLNHRVCWPLFKEILGWAIFLSTIVIFSIVYFKKFGLVIFLEVGTSHCITFTLCCEAFCIYFDSMSFQTDKENL